MKKKLLIIIALTLSCIMVFTACGGENNGSGAGGAGETAETADTGGGIRMIRPEANM